MKSDTMNKISRISILLFFVIAFTGCKQKVEPKLIVINGTTIKSFVEEALNNKNHNNPLFELIELKSPNGMGYNKIVVDSLIINKKTLYSVLIENENPVYNLFSIIDNDLKLHLKDESLNGHLSSGWNKNGSRIFAIVNEEFKSKGVIELKRVSYYQIDDSYCELSFRQFTSLKSAAKQVDQNIIDFSDTLITTEITDKLAAVKKTKKDFFKYNVLKSMYISKENLFDSLVVREINMAIADSSVKELINPDLRIQSLSNKTDSNYAVPKVTESDFYIKLNDNWKKIGNYKTKEYLKKELQGLKFINSKLESSISIFRIAPTDSAENYFNFSLSEKIVGRNGLRFSEMKSDAKYFYRMYEFVKAGKKLLLLFTAPKSNYENFIDVYNPIIYSFEVK